MNTTLCTVDKTFAHCAGGLSLESMRGVSFSNPREGECKLNRPYMGVWLPRARGLDWTVGSENRTIEKK